jgi:hypothetical protein
MITLILLSAAAMPQTTITIPAHDSKCMNTTGSNWNDNRFRAYWSGDYVDGVAKFNLSGIPNGATITGVTLRAYHELGFGNPHQDPEVRVYRTATDSWARGQSDPHPGLNESLTGIHTGFPSADLIPVDFVLNANAIPWATDLADDVLSLVLRNEAGLVGRYSYVYFYGSDAVPAPPELIVEYTSGPTLTIANLTGGAVASFTVSNATPNANVGVALSRVGGGPANVNTGFCGALTVLMQPPLMVVGVGLTNGAGTRSFQVNVPAAASGRQIWSQGLDFPTCTLTNGVTRVVG